MVFQPPLASRDSRRERGADFNLGEAEGRPRRGDGGSA